MTNNLFNAEILCPAKINIQLKMTGLRPDGYHNLRTLMQTVSLADTLSLIAEPGAFEITFRCIDDTAASVSAPSGDTNLVVRAAQRFADSVPLNYSLKFELTKRIPVGAGLGGGSSDAAGAIRLLQALTNAPDSVAQSVARDLGCDVPFFLTGGCQWMVGRGDEPVSAEPSPAPYFVIIYPGFPVSTAAVFKAYDSLADDEKLNSLMTSMMKYPDVRQMGADNDLFTAAMTVEPRVRTVAGKIIELSAADSPTLMSMSGSGSAFYIAYKDKKKAALLAEACLTIAPDTRTFVCEPVDRLPEVINA